jgi:hypothetical protein
MVTASKKKNFGFADIRSSLISKECNKVESSQFCYRNFMLVLCLTVVPNWLFLKDQ